MATDKKIEVIGVGAANGFQSKPDSRLKTRPAYLFTSCEDKVYHERRLDPQIANNPEYCAFLDKSWVFNRAMKWTEKHGAIICSCPVKQLLLTGKKQVSEWFSDPVNRIISSGPDTSVFVKESARQIDCAVLPGLQFNCRQHRHLELSGTSDAEWQFCVYIKGRSGPPLIASKWQKGKKTLNFDLRQTLAAKGFDLQFPELHFAIGTWDIDAGPSKIEFSLKLKTEAVIIPQLPVIRTLKQLEKNGFPVTAIVNDANGRTLKQNKISLYARFNGKKYPLNEKSGVWSCRIHDIAKPGNYKVDLVSEGEVTDRAILHARVTSGNFFTFDRKKNFLEKSGALTGPLNGSFQGMTYFKNAGLPGEKIVQGQQEWDAWNRTLPPGETWHYWEALTADELEQRFSFLEKSGWNLLHLCQHWGIWEKLDVCGHIAPHGAEQLALFYRLAEAHGLFTVQALSHYPYNSYYTPPVRQYYENGYKEEYWTETDNAFTPLFHAYLRDFLTLFAAETAILGMTTSGEGDIAAKAERVNDTCKFVKSIDKNHLFISEPIHKMRELPETHFKGWKGKLYGARLYWIGEEIEPDIDISLEFKFMNITRRVFMAEGSFPCPHKYQEFIGGSPSWCGTERYRRRVRDSFYIGLVERIPLMLTWEEQLTENEHILLDEIRRLVDWNKPFAPPPVLIEVDDSSVIEKRKNVADYARFLAAIPVASGFVKKGGKIKANSIVVDGNSLFDKTVLVNPDGTLKNKLAAAVPLSLEGGYHCYYSLSADRTTLLAYLCNGSKYEFISNFNSRNLAGNIYRVPESANCKITLRNLADKKLTCRVYNLDAKKLINEKSIKGSAVIDLGNSDKDYFILVT